MTRGRDCGLALFADNLQTRLRQAGIEVATVAALPADVGADIVLLQHHEELMSDAEVIALTGTSPAPVVLFAHSEAIDGLHAHVDGLVAMCPGMLRRATKPAHVFPHPAWVPPRLEDRTGLRRAFGLPQDRFIAGTSGFLKFERQFPEVVEALLPEARRRNGFIELITSPWRLESPGLIARLRSLQERNREHFRFEHSFLDPVTLNRRLQACDLLWCWTDAPSSAYASGVASDQYASGTRVFAAEKQQHGHVLALPNVVAGAPHLAGFTDGLTAEMARAIRWRHDPAPVSWDHAVPGLAAFLHAIAT